MTWIYSTASADGDLPLPYLLRVTIRPLGEEGHDTHHRPGAVSLPPVARIRPDPPRPAGRPAADRGTRAAPAGQRIARRGRPGGPRGRTGHRLVPGRHARGITDVRHAGARQAADRDGRAAAPVVAAGPARGCGRPRRRAP